MDHIFDADVWIFLMVKKLPVCVDQVSGHPTPEHSHNEGEELGLLKPRFDLNSMPSIRLATENYLQLGTSSRAIHGGAYFSAVSGRKFNLTTVLRLCRPLACCWMFFFPPSVTFVLDFTEVQSPMGLALYFQVDLSPKR